MRAAYFSYCFSGTRTLPIGAILREVERAGLAPVSPKIAHMSSHEDTKKPCLPFASTASKIN